MATDEHDGRGASSVIGGLVGFGFGILNFIAKSSANDSLAAGAEEGDDACEIAEPIGTLIEDAPKPVDGEQE